MGGGCDAVCQLQFRPSKLTRRPDVPCPLLERQLRFQDDHILRPADGHGLGQHFRRFGICAVKIPHPPQVPGGEARGIRVGAVQVLRSRHRRALLRPAADQSANFTVQLHLGQICRPQRVQRCEQDAVIGGLPDVHRLFLSGAVRLIFETGREKHGNLLPRFSLPAC